MPIYTYHCETCKVDVDRIRKIAERDVLLPHSDNCHSPLVRKVDRPGMVWAPTAGGMKV